MELTTLLRQLRQRRSLWIVILLFFVVFIVFAYLLPFLYKSDLRCQRDSYDVFKDKAVTSCVIKNYGRRSAERTRMSVEFLSKILDITFSPEYGGTVVSVAPEKRNAVLELANIAPEEQVTILFTVERPQDKPFDIHLLDVSGEASSLKDRAVPLK